MPRAADGPAHRPGRQRLSTVEQVITVSPSTVMAPRTKASERVSLVTSPRHSTQSPRRTGATNSEFTVIVATRSSPRSMASMAKAVSAESAKASSAPPWTNPLALVCTRRARIPATRRSVPSGPVSSRK